LDEKKRSLRELDDNDLAGVTGGSGGQSPQTDYLCPCSTCELDTQWRFSPDGASVICERCGAVRMRRWYDENKIRRK